MLKINEKWSIKAESYCYSLVETHQIDVKDEKGNVTGQKDISTTVAYATKLDQLIDSLMSREIRDKMKTAKTLAEIDGYVKATAAELHRRFDEELQRLVCKE